MFHGNERLTGGAIEPLQRPVGDGTVGRRQAFCHTPWHTWQDLARTLLRPVFNAFFAFLALTAPASAGEPDAATAVTALIRQAETLALADSPYWHALMHYRKQNGSYVSEIRSSDFFLAAQGRTDPGAELIATIAAFFDPVPEDPNHHAQCRFIARYRWLRQTLHWEKHQPPPVSCDRYLEWSHQERIESISVLFATGYLSNPASAYGHLLIRFNTDKALVSTHLLDESINFGAVIPDKDNALTYVIKGIFGGYVAGFSHGKFYRHNHNYGEIQFRDLWEYELILSEAEKERLILHSWELLGAEFTYYFFKKNCAYRMAQLIGFAIGEPHILPDLPWAIPATLVDRLMVIDRQKRPLVRRVRRLPSRETRYIEHFLRLTPDQQHLARAIVAGRIDLDHPAIHQLSAAEQSELLETLMEYYEFRIIAEKNNTTYKAAKQNILFKRLDLPPRGAPPSPPVAGHPPHTGPLPGLLRVGRFHNATLGNGIELRFRPAYFDFLSLESGRQKNARLTMFDFRIMSTSHTVALRKVDFVNVETLNFARTRLPGENNRTWNFAIGIENQDLSCKKCLVLRMRGGLGKAASWLPWGIVFGGLDMDGQSPYQNAGWLGAAVRVGFFATPAPGWKTRLDLGWHTELNKRRDRQRFIRWRNRFGTHRRWDLRLSVDQQVTREVQLALSMYW